MTTWAQMDAQREMWEAVSREERLPDRSQYRAMRARYSGKCDGCGRRVRPGMPILYTSHAPVGHKVFCEPCGEAKTEGS